jgi:predicted GH43/DUF377 family glycosyl hydrolase
MAIQRYSLILLFTVILAGCTKNNTSVAPSIPNSSVNGSMVLKIDKVNAPPSVVMVVATLSRTGYDPLSGVLNLLSDTSADISFDKIPIGSWHLQVNAEDSRDTVLYTGSADVAVAQDETTEVNLTLNPVNSGTGSIHVVVTWGSETKNWVDYEGSPVLSAADTDLHRNTIYSPRVIYDQGTFKMWFTSIKDGENNRSISYAISGDGLSWSLGSSDPVIEPGTANDWDYNHVLSGPVIKVGDTYRMYYGNASDYSNDWLLGLATSTDGVHWEKYGTPILIPTAQEGTRLGLGSIIKIDSLYYLYYHASVNGYGMCINLATSADGIQWTRYANNPILHATESWEGSGIYHASVIYDDGVYRMAFMSDGSAQSGFGFAVSTDGKTWTKDSNNPFFTPNMTTNDWANAQVAYASLVKVGSEYRLYYSGYDAIKNDWMIGIAIKQ